VPSKLHQPLPFPCHWLGGSGGETVTAPTAGGPGLQPAAWSTLLVIHGAAWCASCWKRYGGGASRVSAQFSPALGMLEREALAPQGCVLGMPPAPVDRRGVIMQMLLTSKCRSHSTYTMAAKDFRVMIIILMLQLTA
jgi:hypothetical protein